MTAYRATLCAKLSILTLAVALAGTLAIGRRDARAQTTATTATTATTTTLTTTPPVTTTTATNIVPVPVATGNIVNIVGGVMVNVDGVLTRQNDHDRAELLAARRKAMQAVAGDLNQPTKLRMISLKGLEKAIAACVAAGKPLPDEIRYLAGLTRAQYVFVFPELNDVVLAGPAEGWKVNDQGDVVGSTSGHPVLQLDDLLVGLRCADAARTGGISCSIDPTPGGLQAFRVLNDQLKAQGVHRPDATPAIAQAMEQAIGKQMITVKGVPTSSRFANVLVAADFLMKRIGMNFEPSHVKGLPSYLDLIPADAKVVVNMLPRWWMAPNYDPLATDGKGLAWELKGQGVMCVAEEDMFNASGQREQRMKANPYSQKWADLMTKHYDELSEKYPVFGDLRNCMDLAVVGALIMKEGLLNKADLKLPYLTSDRTLTTSYYNPPSQVDSKASFVRKGNNDLFSVSGGVDLQPWAVIEKSSTSDAVDPVRIEASKARGDRWWWN
jgi:hypothetical protein